MSDNDDQSRSDNIFYMKKLHSRSCKALGLDEDSNSWFDIVDIIEGLAKEDSIVVPKWLADSAGNWSMDDLLYFKSFGTNKYV